jgi:hypothetical protein
VFGRTVKHLIEKYTKGRCHAPPLKKDVFDLAFRPILGLKLKEPCVLYIGRAYRNPPDVAFYIYIFSTTISTEYFKHAAHSPFFFSKCRLFHNATFYGSCIIYILHTGCAKI